MVPTNYEALCSALDKTEDIKANFKKLFTERFSNFMSCPSECVEIIINETATSLNPVTFRADLKFKVTTGANETTLCVNGLVFKHHLDKAVNYQDACSYKGTDILFTSNPSPMFFEVLKDLRKTLVTED